MHFAANTKFNIHLLIQEQNSTTLKYNMANFQGKINSGASLYISLVAGDFLCNIASLTLALSINTKYLVLQILITISLLEA